MSKPRPSLESIAGTVAPRPDNVIPGPNPATKPEPVRKDKPHVSLYLDKRVQKVIKEIALAYDRKPHDLYIERVTQTGRRWAWRSFSMNLSPPSKRRGLPCRRKRLTGLFRGQWPKSTLSGGSAESRHDSQ
jgi:hypothetical protein